MKEKMGQQTTGRQMVSHKDQEMMLTSNLDCLN